MLLAAFEATGPYCSVALANEEGVFAEWQSQLGNAVAGPMLDSLLSLLASSEPSLTEVDCFAACVGPGSFTGVKIAVTLAKTLAHALRVPTVAVGSLEAMAGDVQTNERLACILPAKTGFVYMAVYKSTQVIQEDRMTTYDDAMKTLGQLAASGEVLIASPIEWSNLPDGCEQVGFRYPNASSVARIAVERYWSGNTTPAVQLVPRYVAPYSITQPKRPFTTR